MNEAQLQALALRECEARGLKAFHSGDSRRDQGDKGFPDMVIVSRARILWRELKGPETRVTREQLAWHRALREAGADVGVWRPEDWESGRIQAELAAA